MWTLDSVRVKRPLTERGSRDEKSKKETMVYNSNYCVICFGRFISVNVRNGFLLWKKILYFGSLYDRSTFLDSIFNNCFYFNLAGMVYQKTVEKEREKKNFQK